MGLKAFDHTMKRAQIIATVAVVLASFEHSDVRKDLWFVLAAFLVFMGYIGLKEPIKPYQVVRLLGSTCFFGGIGVAIILGRWWIGPIALF